MAPQTQQGTAAVRQSFSPDGRQTRIDFFRSSKRSGRDSYSITPKKATFEWWQVLTGWLRSTSHEQESQLEGFHAFLKVRDYSDKTCKSYLFMMKKFFDYMKKRELTELTLGDIEDYNYDFFVSGRYSRPYQLQFINAMTLYLEFAQGIRVNLKGLRRSVTSR